MRSSLAACSSPPVHRAMRNSALGAVAVNFALAFTLAGCGGMFARKPPESVEILARPQTSPRASVKHILIGWSWLAAAYRQSGLTLDARAEGRNQTDAEHLAADLLARLKVGEPIEPLMKQFSEDEGSAQSGIAYPVTPASRMADDFLELSLRLNVGESGIVKSKYGYHVIQRVQ